MISPPGPRGGWWLTVILCLMGLGLVFLMRWAENRAFSENHASYHEGDLLESLMVQSVYEAEPRAVRWLSGYLGVGSFYREQTAGALAAERDGYLTPSARQTMALVAHRAGDGEKSAYWREGPPPPLPGTGLEAENREALKRWMPGDSPSLTSIILGSGMAEPRTSAARLYWREVWTFSSILVLGILLLPCGAHTIHLLEGRLGTAPAAAGSLMWRPGPMFGAWLRADWCFAFGGLVFTVGYYLAWLATFNWPAEDDGGGPANAYLRGYEAVYSGGFSMVAALVFTAGPVWLLARKFTGGLRDMVRVFGLGVAGQDWRGILKAALGGAWLAMVMVSLAEPVMLRLGWLDPRDGWRFSGESLSTALIYGCLMAPVMEELVFRGFLFTAFANRWSGLRAAVLSNIAFAAVHGYSWVGFLIVMGYGLVFCGLFRRTGSLWPPILAHALVNALIFGTAGSE